MIGGVIRKTISLNYEAECDSRNNTVSVFYKGEKVNSFAFDKYYKAVNFYARLKRAKDAKQAAVLKIQYQ